MTFPPGSIPSDDFDLLSLYLDDKLTASERRALETRLAAEPALRNELDTLRQTVQILRATPQLQLPRNFTLDPARYQRRFRLGSYLLLPLGAIGTFAAVILIALGIFLTPASSTSNNAIALKPSLVAKVNQATVLLATSVVTTEATTEPTNTVTHKPTGTKTPRNATVTTLPASPAAAFAAAPTSAAPRPLSAGMQSQSAKQGQPQAPQMQNGLNAPNGSGSSDSARGNPSPADQSTGGGVITSNITAIPSPTSLQNAVPVLVPQAAAISAGTAAATVAESQAAQNKASSAALGQLAEALTASATATETLAPTTAPTPTLPTLVAVQPTAANKSAPGLRQASPAISTGQAVLIAGIALLVLSGILLMVGLMRNFMRNLTRTRP